MMNVDKRNKSELLGETILDLGKLSFAGIVIAGIFDTNFNKIVLSIGGVLFCLLCITVGIYLITKK